MNGISNDLTLSGSKTFYNKPLPPAPTLGVAPVMQSNMPDVNLRSQTDFLKQSGISPDFLDRNKLYGMLAQGAGTALQGNLQGVNAARNMYSSDVRGQQSGYIDAVRRANAGAIQSGASRGSVAAQELSNLLGLQQQTVAGLTPLAQQQQQAYSTYGQAMSDALSRSESTAFDRNNTIAALAAQLYQFDSDRASTKYAADTTLSGNIFNALQNSYADKYVSDQSQRTDWGSLVTGNVGGANTSSIGFDPAAMLGAAGSGMGGMGGMMGGLGGLLSLFL